MAALLTTTFNSNSVPDWGRWQAPPWQLHFELWYGMTHRPRKYSARWRTSRAGTRITVNGLPHHRHPPASPPVLRPRFPKSHFLQSRLLCSSTSGAIVVTKQSASREKLKPPQAYVLVLLFKSLRWYSIVDIGCTPIMWGVCQPTCTDSNKAF